MYMQVFYCAQVRKQRESEGCVLYYVSTNPYRTIGLCKLKTVWYIIVRALREKVSYWLYKCQKDGGVGLDDMIRSTKKRLDEINRWLDLSQESYKVWQVGFCFCRSS